MTRIKRRIGGRKGTGTKRKPGGRRRKGDQGRNTCHPSSFFFIQLLHVDLSTPGVTYGEEKGSEGAKKRTER